ncbi:MAG: OmpA family protein, partial [Sandaracinaceae bacterium]
AARTSGAPGGGGAAGGAAGPVGPIGRDGDKVVDAEGRCHLDREDFDEVQDTDGCPEENADQDGFPDVDDACPLTPGTGTQEGCAGCPAAACVSAEGTIDIRERIEFETNSDVLVEPTEDSVLGAILSILQTNAEIQRVRVEGHTDDRGPDEANQDLSARRAQSVVRWLTGHGVEAERLEPWGCGEAFPVTSNGSARGRARNRRVEFLILEPSSGRPVREGCQRAGAP